MKLLLFLFIVSTFYIKLAICQENTSKTFTLEGTINIDTGSAMLRMIGDSSVYPKSIRHLVAPIINGKFSFKNEIPHAMAYRLETTNNYYSDVIVIEQGTQKVNCNIDSSRKVPEIKNNVMQEYARYREMTKEFRVKSDLFDKEQNELRKKYPNGIPELLKAEIAVKIQSMYDEGDRNLLAYVQQNPGSYWALWRLINLTNFGYEQVFDEIMPLFADSIKNSYSGRRLAQILKSSKILAVGNKFPRIELLTINGSKSPGIRFNISKYTLIDFWYTKCGPCLAAFPSLVKIYDTYHSRGFEIAGIATDALKYGKDLPIVIKKHNLKWMQFWDLGGKQSGDLSIYAFPTNFLVDAHGVIIQKNIRSSQLAVFLEKNL
jgi:thiol-disulfide isomerase/thioredoxin